MWFFHRPPSLEDSGFFRGFTDWHCHLLPGVDDGVQTSEESLRILAEYERMGVAEAWLTPHVMEDMPNETSRLRGCFAELKAAYAGSVRLHLAAEHMLDRLFEERLNRNDVLPIGPRGDHLLVETSYFNPPLGFHALLERIRAAGYYPLLAHPERYAYMEEKDYERLKDMGVKFQLNVGSLGGYYGTAARRTAVRLLEKGHYDCAGTDLHKSAALCRLSRIPCPPRSKDRLSLLRASRGGL